MAFETQHCYGEPTRKAATTNTPPKFNIAPEKWWLEDEFPFGIAYFRGYVKFQGCTDYSPSEINWWKIQLVAQCLLRLNTMRDRNLHLFFPNVYFFLIYRIYSLGILWYFITTLQELSSKTPLICLYVPNREELPSVRWGHQPPIHPASSDVSAIRQAATRWCLQGRPKIFEGLPTDNPGVKADGNLKQNHFQVEFNPFFKMWSWTRLASTVLIHAEVCVGQIGGKASACMLIAMFVGWSSIECLVVGIVIFVSTIWHLFCLLVEEILYTEILVPTDPRFTFLLGRGLFSRGKL